MKILLVSHLFWPSIGGIEVNSQVFASEFSKLGHEIQVVTSTPLSNQEELSEGYKTLRQPTFFQSIQSILWADVVFINNPVTFYNFFAQLLRKPMVTAVRTWICPNNKPMRVRDHFKKFLIKNTPIISISHAIASHLPSPSTVIGNAYRDDLFYDDPKISKDINILFMGRLVDDKGVELIIESLALLKKKGIELSLTILGEGPSKDTLVTLICELELSEQISFSNHLESHPLREIINRHQIIAIPSKWQEPFGNIALEGIACGCIPVARNHGGLPDAIGNCGILVDQHTPEAFSDGLLLALDDLQNKQQFKTNFQKHLQAHRKETVSKKYLEVIMNIVSSKV